MSTNYKVLNLEATHERSCNSPVCELLQFLCFIRHENLFMILLWYYFVLFKSYA
jgi:hypothetical protein